MNAPSDIRIRRAESRDAPAIVLLLAEAFAEYRTLYTPAAYEATDHCKPTSGHPHQRRPGLDCDVGWNFSNSERFNRVQCTRNDRDKRQPRTPAQPRRRNCQQSQSWSRSVFGDCGNTDLDYRRYPLRLGMEYSWGQRVRRIHGDTLSRLDALSRADS